MSNSPVSKRRRKRSARYVDNDSEYIAAGIKPNYVDSNGMPKSFKVVWLGSIVLLSLIGAWMIYNNESSTGYAGGSRFVASSGKQHTINGYNVLCIALFMALFSVVIFWPRKKKEQHDRE